MDKVSYGKLKTDDMLLVLRKKIDEIIDWINKKEQ